MTEVVELIKTQSEQIDMLKDMLYNQKEMTQVYKDHCKVLQQQVDEALELINRSQDIIKQYQEK
jgi:hypothetical protein